ncbi:MAG: hypothetical protein ACFB4I_13630 [Cyanophyceae cyanobacterium]
MPKAKGDRWRLMNPAVVKMRALRTNQSFTRFFRIATATTVAVGIFSSSKQQYNPHFASAFIPRKFASAGCFNEKNN